MIDQDIDSRCDRELHEKFLKSYREHLKQAMTWPPMDLYELFYRAGRADAVTEVFASLEQTRSGR